MAADAAQEAAHAEAASVLHAEQLRKQAERAAQEEAHRARAEQASAAHQQRLLEEETAGQQRRELATSLRVLAASAHIYGSAVGVSAAPGLAAAVPVAEAPQRAPQPSPTASQLFDARALASSLERGRSSLTGSPSLPSTQATLQRQQASLLQARTSLLSSPEGVHAALHSGAHLALLGLLAELAPLGQAAALASQAQAQAQARLQQVGEARKRLQTQLSQKQSIARRLPSASPASAEAVAALSKALDELMAEEVQLFSECSRTGPRVATAEQATAQAAQCAQAALEALAACCQQGGEAVQALAASGAASAVNAVCAAFESPHTLVQPLVNGQQLARILSAPK